MKQVCILASSFPRYKGDYSGVFIFELAKRLVQKGNEVDVVAPHDYRTLGYEVMEGVRVHRFQYAFPRSLQRISYHGGVELNLRKRGLIAKLEAPLFLLSFFLKSLQVCRGCDIIHANWIPAGMIAVLLKRIHKKPCILTLHGTDICDIGENKAAGRDDIPFAGLLKKLSVYVLKDADMIIAVSKEQKNIASKLGVPENKIRIIPNGVDSKNFSQEVKETNDFRILYVGRLVQEKGLGYLLEAMKSIIDELPDASLTIVGEGIKKADLEKHVQELGIREKVRFLGAKPHEEIPHYLEDADVFVLPSLSEGLALVILEAMACGKPIVATNVGGIPDLVVDEETGLLVPPKDSKALAEAIKRILRDDDLRLKISKNSRKRIEERFDWDIICDETTSVYNKVKKK